MYDPPALHAANDRFWQAIRAQLTYGPDALTRDIGFMDAWKSPDLLFSQTCGLPFRSVLHPDVTLVGTPDNALPGVSPGYYCSVLVVHADTDGTTLAAYDGGCFAYNQAMSQSGWAGPMDHLDRAGIKFSEFVETGGHGASARAVAQGRADMAGLDLLSWTLIGEHDPQLAARLRIIDTSAQTPTLPYITAKSRDPAPIRAAVRAAIANLLQSDRDALHIHGLIDIPPAKYLAVPTPPAPDHR